MFCPFNSFVAATTFPRPVHSTGRFYARGRSAGHNAGEGALRPLNGLHRVAKSVVDFITSFGNGVVVDCGLVGWALYVSRAGVRRLKTFVLGVVDNHCVSRVTARGRVSQRAPLHRLCPTSDGPRDPLASVAKGAYGRSPKRCLTHATHSNTLADIAIDVRDGCVLGAMALLVARVRNGVVRSTFCAVPSVCLNWGGRSRVQKGCRNAKSTLVVSTMQVPKTTAKKGHRAVLIAVVVAVAVVV